jgi:hypothetical protein
MAAQRKCGMAYCLAHRGLSHPEQCLMCDQADETIDHPLVSCVFVHQFWFSLMWQVNLQVLSLQPEDASFQVWWKRSNGCVGGEISIHSLFWEFRHFGSIGICVYLRVQPSLIVALTQPREDNRGRKGVCESWPELEASPLSRQPRLWVRRLEVIFSFPGAAVTCCIEVWVIRWSFPLLFIFNIKIHSSPVCSREK